MSNKTIWVDPIIVLKTKLSQKNGTLFGIADIFSCFCHSVFVLFLPLSAVFNSYNTFGCLMLLAWHRTASLIDQRVPALSFFPFFKLALFLTFKGPMLFYYCISNLKESCWLFMASHVAFLMASFTIAHTPFSIHQWKKWPFFKVQVTFFFLVYISFSLFF